MKTDFLLIDFENVQPKDLTAMDGGRYRIKVFLGTHQTKIPLALARALQALGPHAEYIQISGNGSNAVDFHIAYYIGRLAATTPGAHFHVISKDTGFDPLLRHLKEQGISCQRLTSLAAVTGARDLELIDDRVRTVVEHLAKLKAAKPRSDKTLRTTIHALFGKKLTTGEIDALVEQLMARDLIRISDGKVHYESPSGVQTKGS